MSKADIAVIGTGVMGASLARNFHSRGLTVAIFDKDVDRTAAFMAEFGDERFVRATTAQQLVASLKRPRKIIALVPAGNVVDYVLDDLDGLLEADDVVVDGGNSHFPDTERRIRRAADRPWRFVGMGVSGGQEGALKGPAMMPGGDLQAWQSLRPLLESIAAVSDSGPCVAYCGRNSAGHFVKMVHNGIEYGDMQLIAEVYSLMRWGMGMGSDAVGDVFARWNEGPLRSFLVQVTAGLCGVKDPHGDGWLVDQILDVAGQKGTGRWTSIGAIELGVPLSTITAAVDARALSALKSVRVEASGLFAGGNAPLVGVTVDDLEAALYASKVMSYTQGFAMLASASEQRDYGTDLAQMARIWKAGCIIRAAFLDDVYDAFRRRPDLPLLCLDEHFVQQLTPRVGSWRGVVGGAVAAGIAVPALSASLAWFDTIRRARGSAFIIQAQRDWFGAHTYRRVDAPDVAVHTDWAGSLG